MKRIILLTTGALVFSASLGWSDTTTTKTQAAETPVFKSEHDFANATWGMSRSEVLQRGGRRPDIREQDHIVYLKRIAGFDCGVSYDFYADTLYAGKYYFTNNHTDTESYLKDFEKLKSILVKEYGPPVKCDTAWTDTLYKGQPEKLATALKAGHVAFKAEWRTKPTLIQLALFGNERLTSCDLFYFSLKYANLFQKAKQERK